MLTSSDHRRIMQFDTVFKASPGWRPHPRPTDQSLAEIELALGIVSLPKGLVQLAREATYFGVWFASLGPDLDSPTHIIGLNRYWRKRGLPKELILPTYGFDDVCDCLDTKNASCSDEMRVIQAVAQEGHGFHEWREFAPSFELYLERILELFGSRGA